jgi:hypothetical protein
MLTTLKIWIIRQRITATLRRDEAARKLSAWDRSRAQTPSAA